MGAFDDLIPSSESASGAFTDLIPSSEGIAGSFDDLIPKPKEEGIVDTALRYGENAMDFSKEVGKTIADVPVQLVTMPAAWMGGVATEAITKAITGDPEKTAEYKDIVSRGLSVEPMSKVGKYVMEKAEPVFQGVSNFATEVTEPIRRDPLLGGSHSPVPELAKAAVELYLFKKAGDVGKKGAKAIDLRGMKEGLDVTRPTELEIVRPESGQIPLERPKIVLEAKEPVKPVPEAIKEEIVPLDATTPPLEVKEEVVSEVSPKRPVWDMHRSEVNENAPATLRKTDEGKFYLEKEDGTLVQNPKTKNALFDNGDYAFDEYYKQELNGALKRGEPVRADIYEEISWLKEQEVETPVSKRSPQNIVTRINVPDDMGNYGINLGKSYNPTELREFPDLNRTINQKNGLHPDEWATILNSEGYKTRTGEPWTADTLIESLKTGEGRDLLNPEKADVLTERKFKTQEQEAIERGIEAENQGVPFDVPGEKPRGLAKSIEDAALEKALIQERGDLGKLPTYGERNMQEIHQIVKEFVDLNREKAFKIVETGRDAPEGLYPEDIFTGLRVKAELEGDVPTLQRLLESPLVTEGTTMGQRIQALDSGERTPFGDMKDIANTRANRVEKTTGKKPSPQVVLEAQKRLDLAEKALERVENKKALQAFNETHAALTNPKTPIDRKPTVYGAKNKLVTKDMYDLIRKELKESFRGTKLSMGPDLDLAVKAGLYHLEAGAREFKAWSERMVADAGEKIRPFLDDLWKRTKADFHKLSIDDLKGKISNRLEKGKDLSELSPYVNAIAKQFIEEGVRRKGELVKSVHKVLKEVMPEVTPRETMDAISGYGQWRKLKHTEVLDTLREMKAELQDVAKLVDLKKKGTFSLTGHERQAKTDAQRILEKKVNEYKKKYGLQDVNRESLNKSALQAIKTRLENEIKDLNTQIETGKKIIKNKTQVNWDKEALDLKAKRDERKAVFDELFGKPQITDAQKIDRAIKVTEKWIVEYQRKIEAGDITPINKREVLHSTKLDALRLEREKLKDRLQELRNLKNPKKTPEEITLQRLKTRLENETKRYNEKMKNLDFEVNPKKPTELDIKGQILKKERDRAKRDFDNASNASVNKDEMENILKMSKEITEAEKRDLAKYGKDGQWAEYGSAKRAYDKYVQALKEGDRTFTKEITDRIQRAKTEYKENPSLATLNILKDIGHEIADNSVAMAASFDLSFVGRQGFFTALTHPSAWLKGFKVMMHSFVKEFGVNGAMDAYLSNVFSRPNYRNGLYQKAGVLSMTEEVYPTSRPGKIPVIGKVFNASQAAFQTAGIEMRTRAMDIIAEIQKQNKIDPFGKDQAESVGTLINSLTYRGKWGERGVAPSIKLLLWAPNIIKGQWDILTAHTGGAGLRTSFARQQARMNLYKITGEMVAFATIANMLSPGSAEINPTSSAFGTVKVGDEHIDYTAGARTPIIAFAKFITGKEKNITTGMTKDLEWGFGKRKRLNIPIDFALSKFNPVAGVVRDWARDEFYGGEKFSWLGGFYRAYTPILGQQTAQSAEQGMTPSRVLGIGLEGFGVGTPQIGTPWIRR